jgi:hypothetical protein
MAILFLFGAGASFGSGLCIPYGYGPPLGNRLFAALRQRGGEAASAADDLAKLFLDDFEAGMARFMLDRAAEVAQFLKEMAEYLVQFEPAKGNLYVELIKALGGTRRKAVFATLNYDVLIELSASNLGLPVCYCHPPAADNLPVLKLHGSCNFIPAGADKLQNFSFKGDPGSVAVESEVRVATSTAEVRKFCQGDSAVGPAMAVYAAGKNVYYCRNFVHAQQKSYSEAVAAASKIFVVGVRVHRIDEHVWKPLAESKAPIYYVGGESDLFKEWCDSDRSPKSHGYVLGSTFEGAFPHIVREVS